MALRQHSTRGACAGRSPALAVLARHPSSRGHKHSKQQAPKKRRDISTSFRKGPVPRPLNNTATNTQQEELPAPAGPGSPWLAPLPRSPTGSEDDLQQQQLWQAAAVPISLGDEACGSRALAEPVVAAAAVAAPAADAAAPQQGLPELPLFAAQAAALAAADAQLAWGDADPLASLDRVLDSLILAPSPPSRSSADSSSAGSSSAGSSSEQRRGTGSSSSSSQASSGGPSKPAARQPSLQQLAAGSMRAVPAPAVTVIRGESDWEHELAAAAAAQQLLVVKVESGNTLLQGAADASLRFQTHSGRPAPLNTYLLHNELRQELIGGTGAGAAGSAADAADVLQSLGLPVGIAPPVSAGSGGAAALGGLDAALAPDSEPFSPVHSWFKQLAARYAASAGGGGAGGGVRFLSLQGDSPRAKALCRRLGVASGLAVVLVDAASERKLLEVCGTKIETDLEPGLLLHADADAAGNRPSELLPQLTSRADVDGLRRASDVAVLGLHLRAAPACTTRFAKSYARLYAAAREHQPDVRFGVLCVDDGSEAIALSNELGVQQLPAYVLYAHGREVARLSTSAERKQLAEVLSRVRADAAAAGADTDTV